MKRWLVISIVLLITPMFGVASNNPNPYYFFHDRPIFMDIDSTQLLIKFHNMDYNEGAKFLQDDFPEITFNPADQPDIEGFGLFGLNDPGKYDVLMASLQSENYIARINPVILGGPSIAIFVGESIVCRFVEGTQPWEIDDLASNYNLEIVDQNEYSTGQFLLKVTNQTEYSTIDMANLLHLLDLVDYSHPNFYAPIVADEELSFLQQYPFYFKGGIQVPIDIDSSRLFVKFQGLSVDQAIAELLGSYHQLTFDSTSQPIIEDFILFGLTTPDVYDSIVESIESEVYVRTVSPVTLTEDSVTVYIGETIVCRFASTTDQGVIDSLLETYHLVVERQNEYSPMLYILKRTAQTQFSTIDIANIFHTMEATCYSHPNFYAPLACDGYVVNDEYYGSNQWNMAKIVGASMYDNKAWEISSGDTGVYVAVIDQGIEYHEEFDSSQFWWGFDFLFDHHLPICLFPGPMSDKETHGMACGGLLAAKHNNPVEGLGIDDPGAYSSMAGVSPNCHFISIRVLDKDVANVDAGTVADAIFFAYKNKASVINFSLSWLGEDYPCIDETIDSAYAYGRNGLGTLIIFSAGNASLWWGNQIRWPKTKENVLAVGAIDNYDIWYDYSCYGPDLDLVAPSGEIFSEPYLGGGVWSADRMDVMGENPAYFDDCMPVNDVDYRCTFGGTSAAAPLVTGTAALVLSRRPELTAGELMDVLKQSAVTNLDWGSITAPDEKYGYGRVNAFRALVAVARGDANNNGNIDVSDAVYMINFIFKGGPAPQPHVLMGDFNCDGRPDVGDVVMTINYVFKGGPAPEVCTDYLP